MRTAAALTLAQDYSCRHIEGHSLHDDDDINRKNLKAVRELVVKLDAAGGDAVANEKGEYWTEVGGTEIFALLRKFRFPEAHPDLGRISADASLFQDYVSDRLNADLMKWDVAIPHPARGANSDALPGRSFPLRSRESGNVERGTYRVTGSKNRVADSDDAQLGLSGIQKSAAAAAKEQGVFRGDRAYCAQRTKPLLIVHLFKNNGAQELNIKDPIVSLSFCLPETCVPAKARLYQVNKVYQKQMQDLYSDPDDDEVMLEQSEDV
jgi:hypothetical protein